MASSNSQNMRDSWEPPRKRQRTIPPPSISTPTPNQPSELNEDMKMANMGAPEMNRRQSNGSDAKNEVKNIGGGHAEQKITSDPGLQSEREKEVGILCFINEERPGFTGTLKQRYTDFLVNEIAPDGTVVHLKDDKVPKLKNATKDNIVEDRELLAHTSNGNITNTDEASGKITDLEPKESPLPLPTTSETATNLLDGGTASSAIDVYEPPGPTENEKPSSSTKDEDSTNQEAKNSAFVIDVQDDKLLAMYFGSALKDEIIRFHEKILAKPKAKPATFGSLFSEPITDRPLRGRLHGDVRRIFQSRIETESMPDSGKIKLSAAPPIKPHPEGHARNHNSQQPNSRQRNRGQPKGKLGWHELGGEHLHFSLHKENKDTMEVIGFLASRLRIKAKDFSFAGTKDRRAVTVQRVSVFRQHARTLEALNYSLQRARIGDFKYEKHRLELGELDGNQFTITLRDCHFGIGDESTLDDTSRLNLANEVVGQAIKGLQMEGFINYFGLQRFGSFGVGTHEIGKKILKDDFEGAVWAILDVSKESLEATKCAPYITDKDRIAQDDLDRALAIENFRNTGRSEYAIEKLPRKFSGEAVLIRQLSYRPTDFVGAVSSIHRNLRTMYVHAYQSLVWNVVASERWSRYGSNVIKGDLVLIDTPSVQAAKTRDEVDENGEIVIHAAADDSAFTHDDLYQRARPLTMEEANDGKYSIFDVVLPTPGFDVEYPDNAIGDFYKEFMASERGGGLDPGDMRRTVKDFSLSGSYRKLVGRVGKGLGFEIKAYKGETEQLVETDWERLEKSRGKDPHASHNTRNDNRGSDQYANNRGGWEGRNGRNNFHNKRENRSGAQRGFHGGSYNDVRQENAQPSHPNAADGSVIAQKEAMAAWQGLPAKLAEDDKAAAAEWEARPWRDPSEIYQPTYKDTYIQTSADDEGRRTGFRTTDYIDVEGNIQKDIGVESTSALPKEVTTEDSVTAESFNGRVLLSASAQPVTPPNTRAATENTQGGEVRTIDHESPAHNVSKEVNAPNKEPDLPTKIAVIIKFDLGTSQYATMALRELMKLGGVKTYKPDFSMGR